MESTDNSHEEAETPESAELADVHAEALLEFNRAWSPQQDVRLQCLEDRRFVSIPGAQWESDLREQFANRPRFEVNKVHMSVMRIFNEYRNNRISVDFRAKDGGATEDVADTMDGLYRADEQECNAQEAYDNAFDEGVSGGMGAWRVRACYENEEDGEDERQRIAMEPIYDADTSVYFDADAKRQDKRDAVRCWVLSSMSLSAFEEEWGGASSFPKDDSLTMFDWFTPDVAYIAEYYKVEEQTKTYNVWKLVLAGEDADEVKLLASEKEEAAKLKAQGYILARKKKVKTKRIHKYLMAGDRILEDCGYVAGKCIPIIPFYGKRAFIDNVERIQGHVRLTTDLMRLYNMLISLLAEISVYSPIEKPIFTPEQIQGHEHAWSRDSIDRPAYQLINPITNIDGSVVPAGPIGYVKPPQIPQALVALMQLCNVDMQELLGAQGGAEEVVSNVSAKAVELIQTRLDMQTFIYMDNFAKAMKRCGEVWKGMAQELYDEEGRKMKTVGVDGAEDEIEIMKPMMDDKGATTIENDLGQGRFDVVTDVGPSFVTRRDGTVRALSGVLQYTQDPQERAAITGVIFQNLDGEGLQDLKDWNRKRLINMGVIKPTDEEQAELEAQAANAPPDPQAQFLAAESQKSTALAGKATADTTVALANAEKIAAETQEILKKIGALDVDTLIKLVDAHKAGATPVPSPAPAP